MKALFCLLVGYLLGSLSPSALLSKLKKKNLREHGTGNLGATNTMLIFGKRFGILVMLFDIAKAFVAVRLTLWLSPDSPQLALIVGGAAVIGHIFPFYLKFRGGKGLASFGGMILGYSPLMFLILVIVCCTVMVFVNYSVALPLSAAVLFPVMAGIKSGKLSVFLIASAISVVISLRHIGSVKRARSGGETKIRDYIKNELFSKKAS